MSAMVPEPPLPPATYLDPAMPQVAFDPGVMAPQQSFEDLVKLFPLIEKTQAIMRKSESVQLSEAGYSPVEILVLAGAKEMLRHAHDYLTKVHFSLMQQREMQQLFNHYYTKLSQLYEECPRAFR